MPEFMNPFVGKVPQGKLTDRELARALRLSLAAEEEAIHLYEALADATDNKLAKSVLQGHCQRGKRTRRRVHAPDRSAVAR